MADLTPEERAYAAADVAAIAPAEGARRRLSLWRVAALLAVVLAASAAVVAFRNGQQTQRVAAPKSSFMPYVDVTATPQYPFEDAAKSSSSSLVLGFVVAPRNDTCQPTWGAAYSLGQAATTMDLDRRIVRLRERGGQVAISFGGVANRELAVACTDVTQLTNAYRTVVDRYHVDTIDLDIEGDAASAADVVQRRAQAVSALQAQRKKAGHPLRVWLTLPTDPSGLTAAGRTIVADMIAAKVELAGVNVLTMDYGASLATGESLATANRSALTHVAQQLSSVYTRAGFALTAAQAWQHLGATPMIGQNDVAAERFGLDEARVLLALARHNHLRRLSMWSVNRDQPCGPNYANVAVVSDNCSGVDQAAGAFTKVFERFRAAHSTAVHPATGSTGTARISIVDDPATSPYPIWNPEQAYAAATKIVWHRNVYEAKWWTKGDTPDDPVASASDTPWTLIGPVLPGEHPQPTPTLKSGTYPGWTATHVYKAGDRVLFDGVGYQAKWYTSGDVPGITVSDPGQTPWELITSK